MPSISLLYKLPSMTLIFFGLLLLMPLKTFGGQTDDLCNGEHEFINSWSISSSDKNKINKLSKSLCNDVNNNKINEEDALSYFKIKSFHIMTCDGKDLKYANFNNYGESLLEALTLYCTRAYGNRDNMYKHMNSLLADYFCFSLDGRFEPGGFGGFMVSLYKVNTPSIEKFKKTAYSLCSQLKNKEITFDEAQFYFNRAEKIFKSNFPGEMVNNIGSELKKSFISDVKFIIAAIGVIGTLIGVVLGIKKLLN